MYGSTLNYESHFYLSTRELSGIESLNIAYQNSQNTSKLVGYKKGATTIQGATSQSLTLARNLIYNDPLLEYTGENKIVSGSFNYENNASYGFNSGYLTEYSVNCAVGSIPKVNTTIAVYDELASGVNLSGAGAQAIYVPSQGSITATCDNSTTNRVVGFDYSLTVPRKPYYSIGSETPIEVKYIPPIQYSATVQIEVDDAFMQSGYSFLENEKEGKNVSFSIKDRGGVVTLQTLTIPKASLVNEQLTSSSDGNVRLTLNYVGHS
tara:strand:- start:1203 stop:1997 length:795 start_codon:yes stop_codon:yes gene_type:complete